MDISIVVPAYNENESLPELCSWIKEVMDKNNYSYEVVIVDDGSNDGSWNTIEKINTENPAIKGIKFKRKNCNRIKRYQRWCSFFYQSRW